ncbi:MAG: helicase-related protein [Lawsonella sp.]
MTTPNSPARTSSAVFTPEDQDSLDALAPGKTIVVRDETWLVTNVEPSADGWMVTVRGQSELVQDTTAVFYSALDDIELLDPAKAEVVGDDSSHYRMSKLWLEALLRKTPLPYGDTSLSVSHGMLLDPLNYQEMAVRKALSDDQLRPRILIADTVGLGKTLEIGMILSELVRRGRGERILVVTPRHVLEQMQHELWCRFALPFVRLDSAGIQQVRRQLPATRNPFTYYKRAIISLDTLKQPRYKHHLKKQKWDIVVIDECHNVTNSNTQNHELATVLAPNTESLILASATPHNGKKDSFARLLRLLDPSAVSADGDFTKEDVEPLVIRRHRHSPEVANEVGDRWAERAEPVNMMVEPSPAENAVAAELSTRWLHPESGRSPYSGQTEQLFPWTLAKAFLSSPAALQESIENRQKNISPILSNPADHPVEQVAAVRHEMEALRNLHELNAKAFSPKAGKFAALVDYLKEIGVGRGSSTRAVVFAERVATLNWLQEQLPKALGLPKKAVEIMHGGMQDTSQMEIIEQFKLSESPIRVLVTGDVASEGVNLHAQCHHLIHYDIPWSLIRIEQRNGRIDRYGQEHPPVIASLILTPEDESFSGDIRVLSALLAKEGEAHRTLGDASSIMGKYSVAAEEKEIRKALMDQRDPDELFAEAEKAQSQDDVLAALGIFDDYSEEPEEDTTPAQQKTTEEGVWSLFNSDLDFLQLALQQAFDDVPERPLKNGGVNWEVSARHSYASLEPPIDLQQRLLKLPQDYLREGRVLDTFKFATSKQVGKDQLDKAREGLGVNNTTWPQTHFLGPLHPVIDWAADRALANLGRNQIFAIRGDVDRTTILLMGTISNKRGQTISRVFYRAEQLDPNFPILFTTEALKVLSFLTESTGFKEGSPNPGAIENASQYQKLLPHAMKAAKGSLQQVFRTQKELAAERLKMWGDRFDEWQKNADDLELYGASRTQVRGLEQRVKEERNLADSLSPDKYDLRPLLVIVPTDTPAEPKVM